MKRVYITKDPAYADFVRTQLEEFGVPAELRDGAHGANAERRGLYPSVWVRDEDEDTAHDMLAQFKPGRSFAPWLCSVCGKPQDAARGNCPTCAPQAFDAAPPPALPMPTIKGNSYLYILAFIGVLVVIVMIAETRRTDPLRHINSGIRLHENGRYDDAIAEYNKALELDAAIPEVWANRAYSYFEKKDYALAIADLDRAIALNPRMGQVHETRAGCHYELGNVDQALKDYLSALSNQPFRTQLKVQILGCKYELGDLDGAWSETETLRATKNYRYDAARFRSLILDERNKPAEAMKEAEQAISLEPDEADAYLSKVDLLIDVRAYDAALKECDKASKRMPAGYIYEKATRGEIFFRMNRTNEAREAMREAVKLATGSRNEIPCKIFAHIVLDEDAFVQKEMQVMLKQSSKFRWSYYSAAEATVWLARNGDSAAKDKARDKALDYLEEAKSHGFIAWHLLKDDLFLKDLLDHPRFKKLAGLP